MNHIYQELFYRAFINNLQINDLFIFIISLPTDPVFLEQPQKCIIH